MIEYSVSYSYSEGEVKVFMPLMALLCRGVWSGCCCSELLSRSSGCLLAAFGRVRLLVSERPVFLFLGLER